MKSNTIGVMGRNTQGVRAIRLNNTDMVADVEIMEPEEEILQDSISGKALPEGEIEQCPDIIDNGEETSEDLIDGEGSSEGNDNHD